MSQKEVDSEEISDGSEKNDNEKKGGDDNKDKKMDIPKEFEQMVIKFVKLDDLMKEKQKEISELRTQRKNCEDFILKYLDDVGEDIVEITNGKLKKKQSETKVPIKEDTIKDALSEKVNNPELVKEIMKSVDKSRKKNVKVNLLREGDKEKKKRVVKKNDKKK